jgi:pyruvate dehydrogenase E1 component alpha subunit
MVDGNDIMAVYEVAQQAVDRARHGEGPTLVECKTYRWRGHYEGEEARNYTYRTDEEIKAWEKRCPIERFRKKLLEEGISGKGDFDEMEHDIQKEIEEAIQFAESSPFPDPEDALTGIYAE